MLPGQLNDSIVVPIYKKGEKTNCSNYRGISLLLTPYKILSNIMLGRLTPNVDEIIGDVNVVLDITDRLLTKYFVFDRY